MRLSLADIRALPKGEPPTRCYHCDHEGELSPPGSYSPGLCVDQMACGQRRALRRADGVNPVLANRAACEREGHFPGLVNRKCSLPLADALENIGHNTFELWQACVRCGEVLASLTYTEGQDV